VVVIDLRTALGDLQHKIWAHWMTYLFNQCYSDALHHPGCKIIPANKVERWTRQIQTPYTELPEIEQASDLRQADKVISVLAVQKQKDVEFLVELRGHVEKTIAADIVSQTHALQMIDDWIDEIEEDLRGQND
jgi:hypothetical protein